MKEFKRGLLAGIPIALGYLSVSFTFGIMAVNAGLYWWQALLISMTNLTSAGQLAGVQVMLHPGQYYAMLLSQFTINMRYSFMSISLSQKASRNFGSGKRLLAGFSVTDEIFGVAIREDNLGFSYFEGLSLLPFLCWSLGTLLGALMGQILPEKVMLSLNIGLYAMFIAIVVPVIKKSFAVALAVVIAIGMMCLFTYQPMLQRVPMGISISIAAILASIICALVKPVEVEDE